MGYTRTNAYSTRPSPLFPLTLCLHLAILALHSVYIVPVVVTAPALPILPVLLGLLYLSLVLMTCDYIRITTHDPVDPIVRDQSLADALPPQLLGFCQTCGHKIRQSYHCYACGRCCVDFDHHCKYLNSCIAGDNYERFFRLLMLASLFHANVVGQGVWVWVDAHARETVRVLIPGSYHVVWVVVGLSLGLLAAIFGLLLFHCYLNCILRNTTVNFLNMDVDAPKRNPVLGTPGQYSDRRLV